MAAEKPAAFKVVGAAAVIRLGKNERYVYRNALLTADQLDEDNAKHLQAAGLIEPFELPAEESDVVEIPEGDPTADWSTKQLDAYAVKHDVDVKAAKNKSEKVALLLAAKA